MIILPLYSSSTIHTLFSSDITLLLEIRLALQCRTDLSDLWIIAAATSVASVFFVLKMIDKIMAEKNCQSKLFTYSSVNFERISAEENSDTVSAITAHFHGWNHRII